MSLEKVYEIIGKTSLNANKINIPKTIGMGQKMQHVEASETTEIMRGNTIPFFWDELLEGAEDVEAKYWQIIEENLEEGIFITLGYVVDNYWSEKENDISPDCGIMHYDIEICGKMYEFEYFGEEEGGDYLTTDFGITIRRCGDKTEVQYGRRDSGAMCFMSPEFEPFDEESSYERNFTYDLPLNQKIELIYDAIVFDE